MVKLFTGVILAVVVLLVVQASVDFSNTNSCNSWTEKLESVCGATVIAAGGDATVNNMNVTNDLDVAGDAEITGDLIAATGRGATVTLATYYSTEWEKNQADYQLTGVADQTIAQTAMNAAAGGNLIIYSGTVNLTAAISGTSNTNLIMMPTTRLRFADGVADSSKVLDLTGVTNFDVYYGIIDGNKAGQAVKANNLFGAYLVNCIDVNFYGTKFMDCGRSGTLSGYNYYATASGTLTLRDCDTEGSERQGICFFNTTGPVLVENCNGSDSLNADFNIHTAPNVTIRNCTSNNSRLFGLQATAGSDGLIIDGFKVDNSADDNVYLDDVDDAKITNLISDQAGDYGLRAKTCLRLDLSHSDIKNSADNGVFLDTGCDYSKITHNYFYDNKTYGTYINSPFVTIAGNHYANNDNRAICLWQNANDALIVDNTFDDGTDQDYVIQTKTTATWPVRVMVRDNNFTGGALVSVWYNAINSDITVRDNIGYVTENKGSSTGTGAEQTIAHGLVGTPTYINHTGTGTYSISSPSDSTNIYLTVTGGADYNWFAEMI